MKLNTYNSLSILRVYKITKHYDVVEPFKPNTMFVFLFQHPLHISCLVPDFSEKVYVCMWKV